MLQDLSAQTESSLIQLSIQPVTKQRKHFLLFTLLFCQFLMGFVIFPVESMVPIETTANHSTLNSTSVGIIFAMHSIGCIPSAIISGRVAGKVGRKSMLVLAHLLQGVSCACYGGAGFFTNDRTFQALSMFACLLQGVASGIFNVALPSIIINEWPQNGVTKMGFASCSWLCGGTLGPVMHVFLYDQLGYENTLFIYAGLVGVLGCAAAMSLPARVNKRTDGTQDKKETIEYFTYIKNKGAFSVLIAVFFASLTFVFISQTLCVALTKPPHNLEVSTTGLAFSLMSITNAVLSTLIGPLSKIMKNQTMIVSSFLLLTVGILLTGPCQILPDNIYIMAIGVVCIAAADVTIVTPAVPEMVRSIHNQESMHRVRAGNKPHEKPRGVIGDKAAAMRSVFAKIGSILSSIIGGVLIDLTDFRTTCDVMSVLSFFVFIALVIMHNVGSRSQEPALTNENDSY